MRKAFTLMEVNLAILIMTGGVLSILGLYSLGYRETDQSREDVQSAIYADAVISPLVRVLSSPDVTWRAFSELKNYPEGDAGWGAYIESDGELVNDPEEMAKKAFEKLVSDIEKGYKDKGTFPQISWPSDSSGLNAGLVILHEEGSSVVKIGFRAAKKPEELFAMPLYYTEVRFQGDVESSGSTRN